MGIHLGTHLPPHMKVSIASTQTNQQIRFDGPDDMLKYLDSHPGLAREILEGEWVWTNQPFQEEM